MPSIASVSFSNPIFPDNQKEFVVIYSESPSN